MRSKPERPWPRPLTETQRAIQSDYESGVSPRAIAAKRGVSIGRIHVCIRQIERRKRAAVTSMRKGRNVMGSEMARGKRTAAAPKTAAHEWELEGKILGLLVDYSREETVAFLVRFLAKLRCDVAPVEVAPPPPLARKRRVPAKAVNGSAHALLASKAGGAPNRTQTLVNIVQSTGPIARAELLEKAAEVICGPEADAKKTSACLDSALHRKKPLFRTPSGLIHVAGAASD